MVNAIAPTVDVAHVLGRGVPCVEFAGAAWVLFAKPRSQGEVYNDLDGRLVALFRCVRHHPDELARELEWILLSRREFEELRDQPGLTEIQRAARFYAVLKMSFGSRSQAFGMWKASHPRLVMERLMCDVDEVRTRLQGVVIEQRDFEHVMSGAVEAADNLTRQCRCRRSAATVHRA